MNKIFLLLLAGFVLFSITIYHYASPQSTSIEQVCDSQMSVCANCPLYRQPEHLYDINAYSYLFDNNPFSALVSIDEIIFRKNVCMDYLKIINSSLNVQQSQYLNQYFKEGKIVEEHSFQLKLPTFIKHTMVLSKVKDFVIFTRQTHSKPLTYIQKPWNGENLLRYSRIIGWSTLITLLIAYISMKIGRSIFSIDKHSHPFLQITAIMFSLYCSNDYLFFEYFPLIQALYLAVVCIRLDCQTRTLKYVCILWIISCLYFQKMVIVGQVYLVYFFLSNLGTSSLQTNVSGALVFIGLLAKLIKLLIPFNFLAFFYILWTIIFFPFIFIITQSQLSRDQQPLTNKI